MAFKFGRNTEEEEDAGKAVEAKFTELGNSIKAVSENTVSKEEFKKTQESVDFIANEIKASKEAAKKRQEEAARKAAEVNNKPYNPEEAFNEFAEDPALALAKANAPANKKAALALSKITRAELLSGREYYHGEFKTKVDNMIDTGTDNLDTLSNPAYINNCYKLVLAEYVTEGKLDDLKRTAASHSFSDGGSSGKSASEGEAKPKVEFRGQNHYSADKAKFAQTQMGLTDEDIINTAKESVINGLEVVA